MRDEKLSFHLLAALTEVASALYPKSLLQLLFGDCGDLCKGAQNTVDGQNPALLSVP